MSVKMVSNMMSKEVNSNLNDCGFQKVTYKRKFRKLKPTQLKNQNLSTYPNFDVKTCVRRISSAKLEIVATDLFDSVTALLKEGLSALKNPLISEIICFGLGKIDFWENCREPKYLDEDIEFIASNVNKLLI
ncbi:uncharacterized protein LOC108916582 isoform X1 [Anoplophora glabripennis]|uniref:uncharacterized protein LOC108916582 isoform X1 n=1 Tax=Anoplophora glabripennis TaxID=217634 RepID=UPI000C756203|nr:uncharacterized protein LOC108916582 isoform X1 [Anoplophora glabripennis]